MLLNDFNNEIISTFNPNDIVMKIENFPKVGVSCFSQKLVRIIVGKYKCEQIAHINNANGKVPIYKINYKNIDIAFFMSKVGAPSCTIGYEEVIAMGLEKLVLFGTCGVLDSSIQDCSIIIPTSAIRDEGTSYHYSQANDEIEVNSKYINMFEDILNQHNCIYTKGKTWTTDAPYRETREKVQKRKKCGCISVEMECASMAAVANFRKSDFFEFFYAADNLDAIKWDKRSLGCNDNLSQKEKIALLAFELAIKM